MKNIFIVLIGLYILPVANAQEFGERRGPPPNFEEIKARIDSACANDIATLCSGLEGREVMRCLHKNRTSVSEECRAAFPPRPPHRQFDNDRGSTEASK